MNLNPIMQMDLENIVKFAVIKRAENLESLAMHDFLTSLESLLPLFSNNFLMELKHNMSEYAKYSKNNEREFEDTVDEIDKELKRRISLVNEMLQ